MTVRKNVAKSVVLAYLKAHGIAARNSKVGVNFEYEGWNFLLWHDADDPLFFRLTLPGIFDVTDENYAQALLACNTLNWNYKVVKASLYEYDEAGKNRASVWVCYEQMLDNESVSDEIVLRAITALVEAAERFQTMLES
jgi:hypothetical protein